MTNAGILRVAPEFGCVGKQQRTPGDRGLRGPTMPDNGVNLQVVGFAVAGPPVVGVVVAS